jgi:hypothetical protein
MVPRSDSYRVPQRKRQSREGLTDGLISLPVFRLQPAFTYTQFGLTQSATCDRACLIQYFPHFTALMSTTASPATATSTAIPISTTSPTAIPPTILSHDNMAASKKSVTPGTKKPNFKDTNARVSKRPARGFHRFRSGMLNVTPKGGEKEL